MKLVPTQEQENIVKSQGSASPHKITKVVAGAGAAKTTTLGLLADSNRNTSLYLAFNKAMVEEAKNKFPEWVEVRTTHSLAFSVKGQAIANKLRRPEGVYVNVCGTGGEIARHYGIKVFSLSDGRYITSAGIGVAVKETVNRFEYSSDSKLNDSHVSFTPVLSAMANKTLNHRDYRAIVLRYAKMLWKDRINPEKNTLATHDTYLKLYQLSRPDLSQYDTIYLDESQDTNDCVLDIISRQKCKIVLVGDPRQQIYAWRGSVDAMSKIDGGTHPLTTSFRFGQEIADVANMILDSSGKGDNKYPLKGWDKLESKVVDYLEEEVKGVCYLYRTNAALIYDAVSKITKGTVVSIECDVHDFMRALDSALALFKGEKKKVKHESILPFPEWQDLLVEANFVNGELSRIVALIKAGDAERVIRVLSSYTKPKDPDVVMTTAHKSKGREWDMVVLASDFPSGYDSKGLWVGLEESEENLLYVAATRAKKVLCLNDIVREIKERKEMSSRHIPVKIKSAVHLTDSHSAQDWLGEFDKETEKELTQMCLDDVNFNELRDIALEDRDTTELPLAVLQTPYVVARGVEQWQTSTLDVLKGRINKQMYEFGLPKDDMSELAEFALAPFEDCDVDGNELVEELKQSL